MTLIRWTPEAAEDLRGIHDFISKDSPHYATAVVGRILDAVDRLSSYPLSGRVVPERPADDLRELVRPPFRIVYRVAGDAVHILMVFRSSIPFPGL